MGRNTGGGEGRANQQTREVKGGDNGGERRIRPISRPISLSLFDENQMVWLCVTFKFVCFDGIEGKKLVDEVAREKGERKKENKKRKEERELCGMFWSVEEVVGKKEERRKKEKSKGMCVEEKKRGEKKKEKRRKYG